jgi:hypothetical protein
VLDRQYHEITDVEIDTSTDVGFVALQFTGEKAETLLHERWEAWSELAKRGNLSLTKESFSWLDRFPEVRVAYIPDAADRTELIDEMEGAIHAVFSNVVTFEPIYGYPTTP